LDVAETGTLSGELCGLEVDDIDFTAKTITGVAISLEYQLQVPKTQAIRCFPVSDELLNHLKGYLEGTWRRNPQNLVFSTSRGNPTSNKAPVTNTLYP
jgi:integrase